MAGLAHKVALVTGSTSGIGLTIVKRLAAQGCTVILNGSRDQKLVADVQNEITSRYKVKAEYVQADASKTESLLEMCKKIDVLHPKGIDILINNAGFQYVSAIEDFPIEKWTTMINVLLTAPFLVTQHFLPRMKEKGWGRVVNMSSVHGIIASPYKSAYVSAKHGLMGLTKVMALECADSGVVCNAICPGYVDTPILQQQVKVLAEKEKIPYDKAREQFLMKYHPSGRAVDLEHLADAVMFLCSESAAQLMGTGMIMDGGWSSR